MKRSRERDGGDTPNQSSKRATARDTAARQAPAPPPAADALCRDFVAGRCHRENCRFQHPTVQPGAVARRRVAEAELRPAPRGAN